MMKLSKLLLSLFIVLVTGLFLTSTLGFGNPVAPADESVTTTGATELPQVGEQDVRGEEVIEEAVPADGGDVPTLDANNAQPNEQTAQEETTPGGPTTVEEVPLARNATPAADQSQVATASESPPPPPQAQEPKVAVTETQAAEDPQQQVDQAQKVAVAQEEPTAPVAEAKQEASAQPASEERVNQEHEQAEEQQHEQLVESSQEQSPAKPQQEVDAAPVEQPAQETPTATENPQVKVSEEIQEHQPEHQQQAEQQQQPPPPAASSSSPPPSPTPKESVETEQVSKSEQPATDTTGSNQTAVAVEDHQQEREHQEEQPEIETKIEEPPHETVDSSQPAIKVPESIQKAQQAPVVEPQQHEHEDQSVEQNPAEQQQQDEHNILEVQPKPEEQPQPQPPQPQPEQPPVQVQEPQEQQKQQEQPVANHSNLVHDHQTKGGKKVGPQAENQEQVAPAQPIGLPKIPTTSYSNQVLANTVVEIAKASSPNSIPTSEPVTPALATQDQQEDSTYFQGKYVDPFGNEIKYELDKSSCSMSDMNNLVPRPILNMTINKILSTITGQNCSDSLDLKLISASNKRILGHVMESSSMVIELMQLLAPINVKIACSPASTDPKQTSVDFILSFKLELGDQKLFSKWRIYPYSKMMNELAVNSISGGGRERTSHSTLSTGEHLNRCQRFKVESGDYQLDLLAPKVTLDFNVRLNKLGDKAYGAERKFGGHIVLHQLHAREMFLDHQLKVSSSRLTAGGRSLSLPLSPSASSPMVGSLVDVIGPNAAVVQVLHDRNNHHRRNDWLLNLYGNWLKHEFRRQLQKLLGGRSIIQSINSCFAD